MNQYKITYREVAGFRLETILCKGSDADKNEIVAALQARKCFDITVYIVK